jgi:hypothetical protein
MNTRTRNLHTKIVIIIFILSKRSTKEVRTPFKIEALYTLLRTESRLTVAFVCEVGFLVMVLSRWTEVFRRMSIVESCL